MSTVIKKIVGVVSGVGLLGLGGWSMGSGASRSPGLVVPAERFEVVHVGDGTLRWRRLDGRVPGGPSLVEDGVVLTERGGTLSVERADGLKPGAVAKGDLLLVAVRPDQEAIADARGAESAAAGAEALALSAGGRPGLVAAAEAKVGVAKAALEQAEASFARAQAVVAGGGVPAWDADLLRLEVDVRKAELRAAQAAVSAARLAPWESEVAAADARAAAASAWASAADARAYGPSLAAPFDGNLQTPGGDILLAVDSSERAVVQMLVPERRAADWVPGVPVKFLATSGDDPVRGEIAEIGTVAMATTTGPAVWAVVNLDMDVVPGTTGLVVRDTAWGAW